MVFATPTISHHPEYCALSGTKVLTDRVLALEELLRERFVDHHHPPR